MTKISAVGTPTVGLVQFLGSNCDWDCLDGLQRHFGIRVHTIWHSETQLPKIDGLILPGGFSYGDFLRSGGLAAHTHIIESVKKFADKGGAILGICNGFQVLTESHILPGALLKNVSGKFICNEQVLTVGEGGSRYHDALQGREHRIPIAHGDGRYFIDDAGLRQLRDNGQILFRYRDNPNGSVDDIAGVVSKNGRVLGMMPHPERAMEALLGSEDGKAIWRTFLEGCL